MEINNLKVIGICGGGKMGLSFFEYITRFNDLEVVFYIRNPQKVEKVQQSFMRKLSVKIKKGEISENQLPKVSITNNIELLGECDIVFDFISEDIGDKRALFNQLLEVRKKEEQILATGSSSIVPGKILPDNYWKENLFGVHFIYPIQFIKAAEVIYGENSNKTMLEKIVNFLIYIDKKPVPVKEEVGAFTIRIMSRLFHEAFNIYRKENISPKAIDRIVEKANFASPPYDLSDSVGLEIILNSLEALYKGTGEYQKHAELREFLAEKVNRGHLGKKSGRGVFEYSDEALADPYAGTIENPDRKICEAIEERLKMIYLNTCLKLIDGCWIDSKLLDEVMAELYSTQKGPVAMAYEYGLENLLGRLKAYSIQYDDVFAPPGILEYAVTNNVGREEIDRQIGLFRMGVKRPDWYTEDIKQAI